jgi:hypothetical protein
VDLAAARARHALRLIRLQHSLYCARELLHGERSGHRVKLVQHSQAPGARLLAQIQNGGRGLDPGVQDSLWIGMRGRARVRLGRRRPGTATVHLQKPGRRRGHPVPHQLLDVERSAQPQPRQLDARVPAGLRGGNVAGTALEAHR